MIRVRVRACVFAVLGASGLTILELVREQTGTPGFLVGLGLAVLPVPLLMAAFRWLGRAAPRPWVQLLFCCGWGACAAALIAILANDFATEWISAATADPDDADRLGSVVIAPVVEESAKAAALLLVFSFRRRQFTGPADGFVVAGFTATGFAFTENVLYLGNAFTEDLRSGVGALDSITAATFFVRIVLSPFAHPLFTVLTGLGFGAAAAVPSGHPRARLLRAGLPLLGLALAMGVHALWNCSSRLGENGFYWVYGCVMVPVFGGLLGLAVWIRHRRLRAVAGELAVYAAAGWLAPAEVPALVSMPARSLARALARRSGGRAAGRAVARYEADAAALALLRHGARSGPAGDPEFAGRERELLHQLWLRRATAGPALARAAVLEDLLPRRPAVGGRGFVPAARSGAPGDPVTASGPWTGATTAGPPWSRPCALPGGDGVR
ncbi:PrsW family intramembrane metalloprotease [Streptomyces sp. NPDC090445]|uniref:PrsW family intramembrane metalloprotease n=1 Tax=Streptomyces sp. NPDC090445 TaxID=3365963 RepID=UPI0037FE884E